MGGAGACSASRCWSKGSCSRAPNSKAGLSTSVDDPVPPECSVTWPCRPSPHRSMLDSKENDLRATLQELEGARGEGRALQSRLEQEQLQHLQREAQSQQALGVSGRRAGSSSSPVPDFEVAREGCVSR